MFFRLEITSHHKSPNFKNYSKILKFIGEGIKSSLDEKCMWTYRQEVVIENPHVHKKGRI